MELTELYSSDKNRYNRFVAESPSGSFLQSWEWGMWQESLGKEVKRFFIFDDLLSFRGQVHPQPEESLILGKLRDPSDALGMTPKQITYNSYTRDVLAAIQLVKTPVFGKKYYWYAPYGPVLAGGGSDESNESNKLQVTSHVLLRALENNFIGAVFIRIEPTHHSSLITHHSSLVKSPNIQPAITIIVDLNKTNEQLLAAMHHKTRYNIRLAEKHGVEIQSELVVTPGHGLFIKEAVQAIVATQARQHYRGHRAGYYYALLDFFALHHSQSDLKIRIYKAIYQNQLLASGIMIDFGPTRIYLYGGSSELHKNVMAPYLMHWQAIQDARGLGIKNYDLGGSEVSSGGERGFTNFKRGFGGQAIEYAGAYDLVNDRVWYWAYRQARWINRWLKKSAAS